MPSRAAPFDLIGGTEKHPQDQLWRCMIVLRTPDGKETKLVGEFEHLSEHQAEANLKANLDDILAEFRKHGTEVISRNGVPFS